MIFARNASMKPAQRKQRNWPKKLLRKVYRSSRALRGRLCGLSKSEQSCSKMPETVFSKIGNTLKHESDVTKREEKLHIIDIYEEILGKMQRKSHAAWWIDNRYYSGPHLMQQMYREQRLKELEV